MVFFSVTTRFHRNSRQLRHPSVHDVGLEEERRRRDRIGLGVHGQNGRTAQATGLQVDRLLHCRMHRRGIYTL